MPGSKRALIRFAVSAALTRIAILTVAVLLAVVTRFATGSAWAFFIVLTIGVFGGPPVVGRLMRGRSVRRDFSS